MKTRRFLSKGLILAMLIALPLFANGCTWFGGGEDTTFLDDAVQEKRIGELKSLGGMSVGDATHLLEAKSGHTIRLRSLNINLDQEKYLNKFVEVRGVIGTASDGKDVMDVVSIDLAEDEEEENKVKGEEKEYSNSDFGFNLTYLDSWEIEENDTEIIFIAPEPVIEEEDDDDDDQVENDEVEDDEVEEDESIEEEIETDKVVIYKEANPDKLTVEAYLEVPTDPNELIISGYTKSLVGVDQLEGLKKETPDKMEIDIWLVRNDEIYQLTFIGTDNEDTVNNRNTFFSMVQSFKLIGFTPEEDEDEEIELPDPDEPDVTPYEPPEEVEEEEPVVEEEVMEEEEPEVMEEVIEEPETPAVSSSSYGAIAQYISSSINSIAPEDSESGSWSSTNFEFVDPNYVYVDYSDGSATRRVLLTYSTEGELSTEVLGYFEPGETTSWERVDGENPVEHAEKTVVSITDKGAEEAATVKEGYRYFESLPYDFNAQYPSNWYFSGSGGSGDVSHHYGFSNEPVENGNELVSIDIVGGSLPSGASISVGGNTGVKVTSGGETAIYIERDDGMLYKIHGDSEYESYIVDIAASIQAQ